MLKRVSIIGGDLRNVYLVEILVNNNIEVLTYGIDSEILNEYLTSEILDKIYIENNLLDAIDFSNCIITSIPFTKDEKYLNAPLYKNKILLEEFICNLKSKFLILGKIDDEILNRLSLENNKIIDLMKDERLTIFNAVATVEGAIAKMIENTKYTIFHSNILVLGYGRIGKILLNRLSSFSSNLFCMARKDKDITYIEANGFKSVHLKNLLKFLNEEKIDFLVNTIPSLIIGEKELELLKFNNPNTYLLDLASKPGGIDENISEKLHLNYEMYLGIPGKVAPKSGAEWIFLKIKEFLNE